MVKLYHSSTIQSYQKAIRQSVSECLSLSLSLSEFKERENPDKKKNREGEVSKAKEALIKNLLKGIQASFSHKHKVSNLEKNPTFQNPRKI